MLIGYNNDVEYRGKEFHIQTEDHGENDPRIESQLFHQGQILDTEIISYVSILKRYDENEADDKVKSLMWKTHKGLYERLISGEYDDMVGLEPVDNSEIDAPSPEDFQPGQDRVPTAARVVEEKGEEAFEQFHEQEARKHVDLHSIRDQLEDGDADDGSQQAPTDSSAGDVPAPEEVSAEEGAEAAGDASGESDLPEVPVSNIESIQDETPSDEEESVERSTSETEVDAESDAPFGGGSQLADLEGDDETSGLGLDSSPPPELQEPSETSSMADQPATDEIDSGDVAEAREEPAETIPVEPTEGAASDGGSTAPAIEAEEKTTRESPEPIPSSGARAWRGCREPEGMVSIVPLVEAFFDE